MITVEDIRSRYGEDFLEANATDEEGEMDAAAVGRAIEAAEALVDSHLADAPEISMDADALEALLRNHATAIAAHRLVLAKGERLDAVRPNYDRAVLWLADARDGRLPQQPHEAEEDDADALEPIVRAEDLLPDEEEETEGYLIEVSDVPADDGE